MKQTSFFKYIPASQTNMYKPPISTWFIKVP